MNRLTMPRAGRPENARVMRCDPPAHRGSPAYRHRAAGFIARQKRGAELRGCRAERQHRGDAATVHDAA
jgi:hypothetical protein